MTKEEAMNICNRDIAKWKDTIDLINSGEIENIVKYVEFLHVCEDALQKQDPMYINPAGICPVCKMTIHFDWENNPETFYCPNCGQALKNGGGGGNMVITKEELHKAVSIISKVGWAYYKMGDTEYWEAMNTAGEAVKEKIYLEEYHTAKKPVPCFRHIGGADLKTISYCCPRCGRPELERDYEYCPGCGQAIDWSQDDV